MADLVHLRARLVRDSGRHASWCAAAERITESLRAHFAGEPPRLCRIDAGSPHAILDQIVRYEAVHAIRGLRDLSRRLEADRRCYALFSPSMPGEPLVFTEVALTRGISTEVNTILDTNSPVIDAASCDCAMFYSISSCHEGLRGISFGNTLIRQVVERLRQELPSIETFATVSPVPGFRPWLAELVARGNVRLNEIVATFDEGRWMHDRNHSARLRAELLPLCASYLLKARRGTEPLDAVARFHLGNGARLDRINWLGDTTAAGLKRSAGITANYVYDLAEVDANHDAYRNAHALMVGRQLETLAHTASY